MKNITQPTLLILHSKHGKHYFHITNEDYFRLLSITNTSKEGKLCQIAEEIFSERNDNLEGLIRTLISYQQQLDA